VLLCLLFAGGCRVYDRQLLSREADGAAAESGTWASAGRSGAAAQSGSDAAGDGALLDDAALIDRDGGGIDGGESEPGSGDAGGGAGAGGADAGAGGAGEGGAGVGGAGAGGAGAGGAGVGGAGVGGAGVGGAGVGGAGAGGAGVGGAGVGGAGVGGAGAGGAGAGGAGVGGAGSGGSPSAGNGGSGGAGGAECTEPGAVVWAANGHCYYPLFGSASWNVSRDNCNRDGAQLVTITSAAEQAFVGALVGASSRWLGLSRFGAPAFTWLGGEALTYTNWEAGEPDETTEAAGVIQSGSLRWIDDVTSAGHTAICERR
jgi:hypothetical protein